ncbi:MAG: MEDS domain-containing protein [Chitinophagaceae bacterium]|nr:MEDS domain-containing protein [Chitinophagaceae bacterium]
MNLYPEKDLNRVKADVFWGELTSSAHVVQIYEKENAFLETLTGFIGAGINAGDAVVVIATADHLAGLNKRLRSHGLHVGSLITEQLYIPIDADEILPKFMVEEWPDEQCFIEAIVPVIEKAGSKNRRVRAFGEMVALLWAKGLEAAAIQLETYWNRLQKSKLFSLFCAYPAAILKNDAPGAVRLICSCHSHLISGNEGSVANIAYQPLHQAI